MAAGLGAGLVRLLTPPAQFERATRTSVFNAVRGGLSITIGRNPAGNADVQDRPVKLVTSAGWMCCIHREADDRRRGSRPEAILAANSQIGNPETALDAWVSESLPHALAFALSLLGNSSDAEDIVQDCYGRLLAKSRYYDLPREGTKLLLKSISNAAINFVSRRKEFAGLEEVETAPSGSDPRQGMIHRELEGAIAEALAELPVTQRAVVELRSLGHSVLEIADMLEISHANARVLLHRARTQLAESLAPYLQENAT